MSELPSGTVTFLFTDIEGSTRLLHGLREEYGDLLAAHARILRAAFEEHGGREIDTQGDSFFVAFRTAKDALQAAVAAQKGLAADQWPHGARPSVRMGMHTGEPSVAGERYLGLAVHRAARICSAAHGGQMLLSGTTGDLIADELPAGASLRALGEQKLKDFERPERVFQLVVEGLPADFPPLAADRASGELNAFKGREGELAEAAEAAVAEEAAPSRRLPRPVRRSWALAIVALAAGVAVVVALLAGRGGAGDSDVAGAVPSKSVALIEPSRNEVTDSIPLEASPSLLAGSGTDLWIANVDDKTLLRVDARSRRLRKTIGLGTTPGGLVVGAGALWIMGDDFPTAPLLRVTPATNDVREVARPECCDGVPLITGDEERLWISASDNTTIQRIDPDAGDVGPTVCCTVTPDAIVLGEGGLWAVERYDQQIVRIDPDTGSIETKIPFGAPLPPGRNFLGAEVLSAAAAGEGGVWVLDSVKGLVWQIDPVANAVVRTISVGAGARAVVTGLGSVWVANPVSGVVARIEPSTGRVLKRIKVAAHVGGIAVAGGAVWVGVP